ncbi:MAG TPA: phosphoadenylyl-sulfate reductase [Alphaproteobacteria bacterium]|nr:phosphoadenylyl-sulfate reductase [Alphaproteobacteria bacterium]
MYGSANYQYGFIAGADLRALPRTIERLAALETPALLEAVILGRALGGPVAVVSSFGAESAVVLSLIARIDRAVPVIFLDTGKHFPETLTYRDTLVARLGLTDLRTVDPLPEEVDRFDPEGRLWQKSPDHCCFLRKVIPLDRALAGFSGWITGRKRYHGDTRARLPRIEAVDGRIKINPLADWSPKQIREAFTTLDLPRHPLVANGYLSIGCAPCTRPVAAESEPRSGRWQGLGKTECGIHRSVGAEL